MLPIIIGVIAGVATALTGVSIGYVWEARHVKLITDKFLEDMSKETVKEVEKITTEKNNILLANHSLGVNLGIQGQEVERLRKLEAQLRQELQNAQLQSIKGPEQITKELNLENYVQSLQYLRDKYAKQSEKILINSLIGRLKKEYVQ